MPSTLAKLRGLLDRPVHAYRATTETFTNLDVQRLATSMTLAERGRTRGTEEQPPADSTTLDAVETEIIETVTAAQKTAHDELENQLTGFRARLIDLDFEARFSGIKDVAQSGLADLKAEQQMGLDDLHGVRRELTEAEEYLTEFRKQHRINRPAKINTTLGTTLKWLIIALIFLGELITNGYFLSRGAELGLAGGVLQAALFAFLNVGVPLLIAIKGLPFLTHRNGLAKLWGLFWLLFFLAETTVLNLGLAHYREAGAETLQGAGIEVMRRMTTAPLTMADFESWVLFGLGVFFSVIALIDGFSLNDSFPKFQEISDNRRKAQDRYAEMRRTRIQDLMDVREQYQEAVSDLRSDLSKRRTEHEAILAHRARQLTLFREAQNQLETAANALLRIYRDANVAARKTPAPAHFAEPFVLKRIEVEISRENEWNTDELKEAIKSAQADLEKVMATLGVEFDQALKNYRELDQLVPGK
jgi:hypothetical protein